MWLAVLVGAYSRLRGLGTWPWATDGYLIGQSVDNILRYGIPAFDCGGYYMRGLTLQYLIVPLHWLGIHAELAARLIPAACSFAVLAAVYRLGKRLSGVTVACVSVALLSLSLWEIEFARFARMYVPFQAIFLWYLLALHRVVVDCDGKAYKWLWAASVVGVFTWAGGLFLLVVNFLPSLIERAPGRIRHVAVSGGLLAAGYVYSAWNFRFMGSVPPLPSDVPIDLSGGEHIMLPRLLVSTLWDYPVWMAGAVLLAAVCLVAVVVLSRSVDVSIRERVAWVALVSLSFFNLFGCVAIGVVLALLLEWIEPRRVSRRSMLIALVAAGTSFVFWLAYAALTHGWHQMFPGFGPGGGLSKLAVVLIKYPDVFDSVLFPWLAAVPKLTIALFSLTALAGVWALFSRDRKRVAGLKLMLAVCVLMVVLSALVETKYIRTRYTFFLLPVFYLMAVTAVYTLIIRPIRNRPARGVVLGVSLLALVGLTEDFGWAHMVHVDRMKWNYRLPYDEARSGHYYPRQDFRTPAKYVNEHAQPEDVIITTKPPVVDYLDRTDYVYWNYSWGEFAGISCDRGRRERWSGRRLIYRQSDLFKVVDNALGTVWLITPLGNERPPTSSLSQHYDIKPVYRGLGGVIGVYKIEKTQ